MTEVNTDPDTATGDPAGTSDGSALEVKFVGWEPGVGDAPRRHAPRLNHKKSRAGCQQCRTRRVKCDEVHPVCGSCGRHKSGCVWGRDKAAITPAEPLPTRSRPLDIRPKANPPPTGAPEIPESRERRLRELELLHHYTTVTSFGLNPDDPDHHLTLGVLVPRIALKNDSLLYSIFATAALHLVHSEPNEQKHVDSYQKYLGLAIRLHRDDVAKLGRDNADATMLTTTLLRTVSFAVLRLRPTEPYIPPIEWLQMNYGTGPGLSVAAWKFLKDDPTSLMRALILKVNVPGLNAKNAELRDMPVLFNDEDLKHLKYLLKRTPEHELDEPWDSDILFAYSSTVSYIGGVLKAVAAGDPEATVLRRLLLFPTMVEKTFIELVEEHRPRALVVLAHYFGLLARLRLLWWVGEAGPREVEAIQKVVGEEWQEAMAWPLKAIKEEPTSRPPEPDVLAVESRLNVIAKMGR